MFLSLPRVSCFTARVSLPHGFSFPLYFTAPVSLFLFTAPRVLYLSYRTACFISFLPHRCSLLLYRTGVLFNNLPHRCLIYKPTAPVSYLLLLTAPVSLLALPHWRYYYYFMFYWKGVTHCFMFTLFIIYFFKARPLGSRLDINNINIITPRAVTLTPHALTPRAVTLTPLWHRFNIQCTMIPLRHRFYCFIFLKRPEPTFYRSPYTYPCIHPVYTHPWVHPRIPHAGSRCRGVPVLVYAEKDAPAMVFTAFSHLPWDLESFHR